MRIVYQFLLNKISEFYDWLYRRWESEKMHGVVGSIVVMTFLITLLLVQLKKWNFIHGAYIPDYYLSAVGVAFTTLLIFEVLSLVFILPRSFARSVLKQFEILSLIMLRTAFKEFYVFEESLAWHEMHIMQETIMRILSEAGGALVLFIGIFYIQRMQKHKRITSTEDHLLNFIKTKKVLSIILLFIFISLGVQDTILFLNHAETFAFFPSFYSILIFADVMIILISLRYSYSYIVVFRNSAFALVTMLLRISLTAPVYYNTILAILTMIFVIGLTYFYNRFRLNELYREG